MNEEVHMKASVVNLFCELASLYSPSFHEGALADRLRCWLKDELNLETEEDNTATLIAGESGNLICRIPGEKTGPMRLFAVHLDTVEPCRDKKIIIADDIIKTDGTTILGADDLAGVAAVLSALKKIKKQGTAHCGMEILFTVAEEQHLQGSRHIKPDWIESDIAYVLDTSGAPGMAVNKAPGHIYFEFHIKGKAAHAGIEPEQGVSAIQTAAQAIAQMKLGAVGSGITANIGEIEGGKATNIVSEHCVFTAECRAQSSELLEQQADHMQRCVEQACQEAEAELEFTRQNSYKPFYTPDNADSAVLFRQACAETGLPVSFSTGGGGSDLNHLVQLGLEGLVLATGMTNVHSCEEQISIRDLLDLTRLIEVLMTI